MELSAIMLQLEVREKELMKYVDQDVSVADFTAPFLLLSDGLLSAVDTDI